MHHRWPEEEEIIDVFYFSINYSFNDSETFE